MRNRPSDPHLDTLLDLNGQVFVVDETGNYWVKFEVIRLEPTKERPHGIRYSLTLHDANGERLIGYDNSHPIRSSAGPGGKASVSHDHRHVEARVRTYDYRDAGQLLQDFWTDVDVLLRKRGVIE